MSSHELEIIEFFIEPIKGSASGAYYGVTEIDCKTYWNRCCLNGKFLGAEFMCDMAHPVYRAHRFRKKQMRHALECKYNIK